MKTVTKSYFRPYPTHGLAVIQVMTCSENQHDSPSCNQLYTYVLHNRSWTTKLANSIRSISNEFNFTALRAPNWTSKTQFEQNRLHEKRTVNSKQTSTTGNRTFRPFDVSPPGRFAHSLDVSPPNVNVSPVCFSCICCFFFYMGLIARVNQVDWLMDWCIFGRPLGPGICHRKSVRLSVRL